MVGMQELVVILLIVVLVFGAKRIPEIMSGLGKGIKTFKQAVDGQDVLADNHPSASHAPDHPNAPKPTEPGGTVGS
ncbi:MAG: twin-arginine translocase TatA/TatE family subunit [Deltaproteobacteria bacterium]|nr:twin-arginine translocase TatA/TatE family subunit [Deltaproteobacteria bacterium]